MKEFITSAHDEFRDCVVHVTGIDPFLENDFAEADD